MQSQITPEAHDSPPTGNDLRVARTKARIITAVIACLDEVGYSETSINRVQTTAGVSRGALTHHFPSKEAMMVETLERLLDPVRGGTHAPDAIGQATGRGDGIAADMARLWSKVLNTGPGRALVEILVAARTDAALSARIQPSLTAYNDQINVNIHSLYQSPTGDADDIKVLWTICRTFLRGLHLQARFEDNPRQIQRLLERFARIMEPHMTARSQTKAERHEKPV
ncbi:MAG: TetR/AcrR family transcriptional regulator [Rhodobacteraceae bacterium]|nr:TetR/AcrR family transcriptional regulator [Paracoccaceae bacterium]